VSAPGLLVLAGPTAAGKTAAAVHVACLWGAEIVSADAVQVYRGMDIGSGKAPPCVLGRFPHACVDVRDPGAGPEHEFSAADFADAADAVIARAHAAGRGVVVAGGTGFYLRALLVGLAPAPPADAALRAALEALEDPHAELARVDPELAGQLHPNDRVRVVRGLEVYRLTGRPLSGIWAEHALASPRHRAVRLWLDREDLYERIDRRVLRMMERGYLAEVRRLLDAGVPRTAKPMRSLGYRHLADHLLDGLELAEAVRHTQRDSRRFARKQRTFLRGLGGFRQVHAADRAAVLQAAEEAFGPPPERPPRRPAS
jgi:tRNA dimethylallyltransferase